MDIRTLKDACITKGTRVIIRADFDVPLQNGKIANDFRMREIIPTIRYVLKKNAQIIIISHLGRPKGYDGALSMEKVSHHISRLLNSRIYFVKDSLKISSGARAEKIIFLENIRFWKEETSADVGFAKKLAAWGDLYINEAFADSHRNHASISILPKLLPSYAGFRLEKEIHNLTAPFKNPKRPFIAVIGGAKLETKLPLVVRFLKEADMLLMGGAVVNSLFRARGFSTGKSVVEQFKNKKILVHKKLILPSDLVVMGQAYKSGKVILPDAVGKSDMIVDIGPETVKAYSKILKEAGTIIWNGPMGYTPLFSLGTEGLLRAIAGSRAFKIIGGGDSIAALQKAKISFKKFDHISTGGGAMLEFLAGKRLPGIEVLKKIP